MCVLLFTHIFSSFSTSWSHHHVICLVTGPWPLPKRVLQRMQSSASCFRLQYFLLFFRLSSSCLLLHLLMTCIFHPIFPSVTCFRRHFLHKMWPIQLGFLCCIVCGTSLSSQNESRIERVTVVEVVLLMYPVLSFTCWCILTLACSAHWPNKLYDDLCGFHL
jgi:hypothetical protein